MRLDTAPDCLSAPHVVVLANGFDMRILFLRQAELKNDRVQEAAFTAHGCYTFLRGLFN